MGDFERPVIQVRIENRGADCADGGNDSAVHRSVEGDDRGGGVVGILDLEDGLSRAGQAVGIGRRGPDDHAARSTGCHRKDA